MKSFYLLSLAIACSILLIASQSINSNYGIGDSVSDFKLKNVDGKMVSLSDYKDAKGVIIIFDCNTCPYSKAYNDRIVGLNKKFAPLGFPVVAINSNDPEKSPGDSFDEMISHANKNHYDFPYLFDENQTTAHAFGATNTPHVFVLVKKENEFKVAYLGGIDNNVRDEKSANKKYVEDAVNDLLNGRDVATSKTKAIGCGIKWKSV